MATLVTLASHAFALPQPEIETSVVPEADGLSPRVASEVPAVDSSCVYGFESVDHMFHSGSGDIVYYWPYQDGSAVADVRVALSKVKLESGDESSCSSLPYEVELQDGLNQVRKEASIADPPTEQYYVIDDDGVIYIVYPNTFGDQKSASREYSLTINHSDSSTTTVNVSVEPCSIMQYVDAGTEAASAMFFEPTHTEVVYLDGIEMTQYVKSFIISPSSHQCPSVELQSQQWTLLPSGQAEQPGGVTAEATRIKIEDQGDAQQFGWYSVTLTYITGENNRVALICSGKITLEKVVISLANPITSMGSQVQYDPDSDTYLFFPLLYGFLRTDLLIIDFQQYYADKTPPATVTFSDHYDKFQTTNWAIICNGLSSEHKARTEITADVTVTLGSQSVHQTYKLAIVDCYYTSITMPTVGYQQFVAGTGAHQVVVPSTGKEMSSVPFCMEVHESGDYKGEQKMIVTITDSTGAVVHKQNNYDLVEVLLSNSFEQTSFTWWPDGNMLTFEVTEATPVGVYTVDISVFDKPRTIRLDDYSTQFQIANFEYIDNNTFTVMAIIPGNADLNSFCENVVATPNSKNCPIKTPEGHSYTELQITLEGEALHEAFFITSGVHLVQVFQVATSSSASQIITTSRSINSNKSAQIVLSQEAVDQEKVSFIINDGFFKEKQAAYAMTVLPSADVEASNVQLISDAQSILEITFDALLCNVGAALGTQPDPFFTAWLQVNQAQADFDKATITNTDQNTWTFTFVKDNHEKSLSWVFHKPSDDPTACLNHFKWQDTFANSNSFLTWHDGESRLEVNPVVEQASIQYTLYWRNSTPIERHYTFNFVIFDCSIPTPESDAPVYSNLTGGLTDLEIDISEFVTTADFVDQFWSVKWSNLAFPNSACSVNYLEVTCQGQGHLLNDGVTLVSDKQVWASDDTGAHTFSDGSSNMQDGRKAYCQYFKTVLDTSNGQVLIQPDNANPAWLEDKSYSAPRQYEFTVKAYMKIGLSKQSQAFQQTITVKVVRCRIAANENPFAAFTNTPLRVIPNMVAPTVIDLTRAFQNVPADCSYTMAIQESDSWLVISDSQTLSQKADLTNDELLLSGPFQPTTDYKFLHTETLLVYFDGVLQDPSWTIDVEYFLDCSRDKVEFAWMNGDYDKTQTIEQTQGETRSTSFSKAFQTNLDGRCPINHNYKLWQVGKPAEVSTKIAEIVYDSDPDVDTFQFETYYEKGIVLYNKNGNQCTLTGAGSLLTCSQTFKAIPSYLFDDDPWQYDLQFIASLTVEYVSPCQLALQEYASLDETTKLSQFWSNPVPPTTTSWIYQVRDSTLQIALFTFDPYMQETDQNNAVTIVKFHKQCSTVSYTLKLTSISSGLEFTSGYTDPERNARLSLAQPTIQVKTDDSGMASASLDQQFTQWYRLTQSAVVDSDNRDPVEVFEFPLDLQVGIQDKCLGLTYERDIFVTEVVKFDNQYQMTDIVGSNYGETPLEKQCAPVLGNTQATECTVKIGYPVQSRPKIFQIQLHEYAYWDTPTELQNNDCGIVEVVSEQWQYQESLIQREFNMTTFAQLPEDHEMHTAPNSRNVLTYGVYSESMNDMGLAVYSIQVKAADVSIPSRTFTLNLLIEYLPCQIQYVGGTISVEPQVLYFEGRQPYLEVEWDHFEQQPACGYAWQYGLKFVQSDGLSTVAQEVTTMNALMNDFPIIEPSLVDSLGGLDEPKAVLFAQSESQVEHYYDVYVYGELQYSEVADDEDAIRMSVIAGSFKLFVSWPTHILYNTPPRIDFIPETLTIRPGQNQTIPFSSAKDLEDNVVIVGSVVAKDEFGQDYSSWVTLKNSTTLSSVELEIGRPKELEAEADVFFTVVVTFEDDHLRAPMVTKKTIRVSFSTQVEVEEEEGDSEVDFDITEYMAGQQQGESRVQDLPPPLLEISPIKVVDGNAKIKLQFSQPVAFDLSILPEEEEGRVLQNQDDESPPPAGLSDLASLSSQNKGAQLFSVTYAPSAYSKRQQEGENKEITVYWGIELIDDQSFNVAVAFSDNLMVSQNPKSLDKLEFEVLSLEAFTAVSSGKAASAPSTELTSEVPTIATPSYLQENTEKVLKDSFAQAVKAIMAGNFFVSLLLAGAMQYLWGMVNALQVIVFGALFECMQPSNARVIQFEILKATAFDFYQTETLYTELFSFEQTESFSDDFDEAGIQGSNFIIGIGPVFIFMVIFPIYIFIQKSTQHVCQDDAESECCKNFVKDKGFLVIAMIFLLESCVEIGTTCGVCITKLSVERFSTFWEVISSVLGFASAAALIVAPFYILIAGCLFSRAQKTGNVERIEKYGPLFEGKRTKSALAIQSQTVFFVRRYILMTLIVFFPEARNAQINLFVYSTLLVLAYNAHARPFQEPLLNRQEMINELIVLLSGYLLYTYTEYVWDGEMRYTVGWLTVGLIGLNVLINISIMLVVTVKQCKTDLRLKKARRKAQREHDLRVQRIKAQQQEILKRIRRERAIDLNKKRKLIKLFTVPSLPQPCHQEEADPREESKQRPQSAQSSVVKWESSLEISSLECEAVNLGPRGSVLCDPLAQEVAPEDDLEINPKIPLKKVTKINKKKGKKVVKKAAAQALGEDDKFDAVVDSVIKENDHAFIRANPDEIVMITDEFVDLNVEKIVAPDRYAKRVAKRKLKVLADPMKVVFDPHYLPAHHRRDISIFNSGAESGLLADDDNQKSDFIRAANSMPYVEKQKSRQVTQITDQFTAHAPRSNSNPRFGNHNSFARLQPQKQISLPRQQQAPLYTQRHDHQFNPQMQLSGLPLGTEQRRVNFVGDSPPQRLGQAPYQVRAYQPSGFLPIQRLNGGAISDLPHIQ